MVSESMPPPASGGNFKYAIIGLVLLGLAAGGVALIMCDGDPKPPIAAVADAGVQRSTALVEPDLVLPDPEPDAGPEIDAGPPQKTVRIRYVQQDCSGAIPTAQVAAAIDRRQVRACYERRLKANHTLAGRLVLQMQVDRSGRVIATHAGGSLQDPEVFSCVRRLADSWSFPAPTGGSCAMVSVPFNLSPQE